MTDLDRERDDALWRAYEAIMEDFASPTDSVSGKSHDYWMGFVDGLADGTSISGGRAEKSARPRRSSRPHPHLQLVMS